MRLLPALQRLKTVHPCGSALSRRTSIQLLNDGLTTHGKVSTSGHVGMGCSVTVTQQHRLVNP